MQVSIKTVKGEVFTVDCTESSKISFLKEKVQEKFQHEPESQKLIYRGKHLDDNKTLSEYEFRNGDTIILMIQKVGSTESGTEASRANTGARPDPLPNSRTPAKQHQQSARATDWRLEQPIRPGPHPHQPFEPGTPRATGAAGRGQPDCPRYAAHGGGDHRADDHGL